MHHEYGRPTLATAGLLYFHALTAADPCSTSTSERWQRCTLSYTVSDSNEVVLLRYFSIFTSVDTERSYTGQRLTRM